MRQRSQGNGKSTGYRPRVVVKFQDYVDLPYEDHVENHIQKRRIGAWDQIEEKFPEVTLDRLFTSVEPDEIRSMVGRAVRLDSTYEAPNMLSYFVVDCPPGTDPMLLAETFAEWRTVQTAYVEGGPTPPPLLVQAADDPRSANQGYLDPAPDGIDAEFGWSYGGTGIPGADGAGLQLVDLEQGWMLDHQDLVGAGVTLISGLNKQFRSHGTSVLGELVAVDNTVGGVGIAPKATARVVSQWRTETTYNTADAILSALTTLGFGDVLLLEAQTTLAGSNSLPVEVEPAIFDNIRLGTALGVLVVEAAGNGATDLDSYTDPFGRFVLDRSSPDFLDSGALMVGASTAEPPHSRKSFSNHGSRIDCYGWGEQVDTCACDPDATTSQYKSTFQGTSSASPIVAGAALVVQGVAEANHGYRFSPAQLRTLLADPANGTASADPVVDRIGVMPNLKKILSGNLLNTTPDVYLRDFVGDTGDPHPGASLASPDIILQSSPVADPQGTLGQGSGTEDDVCGAEATAGVTNYIYLRARNRGGSAAANVVATVYWSPAATLLTPDLWQLAGSVTFPNVPMGNQLTVSPQLEWNTVPATGHYCFIALLGHPEDPAPVPADFEQWSNFKRFVSAHNNVGWRNFNVVASTPPPGSEPPDFVGLDFLAPGALDKARRMRLEVVGRLPDKSRLLLEAPTYFFDAAGEKSPWLEVDEKRQVARLPMNPHGRKTLDAVLFAAKSKAKMRLLVQIPEELRRNDYEVAVSQMALDEKGDRYEEVGRVSWRLVPPERVK